MAFTYSFEPEGLPVAQLRLLIQDTVEATAFLQDEEILQVVAAEPNRNRAAANACRIIAARLARQAGFKNATIIYDPTEKAKEYRALAKDLDERADRSVATDLTLPADFLPIGEDGLERRPSFTRNLHFSGGTHEA